MIGYAKYLDANMTMSFKFDDNKILKKYNKILEKISDLMNVEFDSELVYCDNDKYIKTKIKMYGGIVNTNFKVKKYLKKMININAYH